MTSRRDYKHLPTEDVEEIDLNSPVKDRRKRARSNAGQHVFQTPRLRRIGLVALFCISLFFFLRLGGGVLPRGEAGSDLSQPPRWGLVDESLRQARIYPLRFSVIQGAVRSQASTYRQEHGPTHFVELLTFLEEPIKTPQTQQQVLVSRLDRIRRITCDIALPDVGLTLNITATVRTPSDLAMLLHCAIPDHWTGLMGLDGKKGMPKAKRLDVTLTLFLTETNHVLQFDLPMKPYHSPAPQPHQVGICTFPFDGRPVSHHKALEWREHHRLLGIGPVHWYERDELLHPFIHRYTAERKVQDTFRFAPQISPEVVNSDLLTDRGAFADQTLWLIDCMLRASYRAPTPFMTALTLDEIFWPASMPPRERWANPMRQMMGSKSDNIGTVQIWPTYPLGPEVELAGAGSRPLYVQELGSYRAPQEADSPSKSRAIHRREAVEIPLATGAAHFYHAGTMTELLHESPVWLLDTYPGHAPPEPVTPYDFSNEIKSFASTLLNATRELEHLAAD